MNLILIKYLLKSQNLVWVLQHCASGNHICTGIIGTLTEKPKNINIKKINCLFSKKIEFKKKSKEELPFVK